MHLYQYLSIFFIITLLIFPGFIDFGSGGTGSTLLFSDGIGEYLTKPNAIYVDTVDKTFFTWFSSNTGGDIEAGYYDHDTNTSSGPYKVENLNDFDDHVAPSMLLLDNGKFVVFWNIKYTGDTNEVYCKISNNIYSVSSWGSRITVDGSGRFYPQPWQETDGTVHCFHTRKLSSTYGTIYDSVSTNDCVSWGSHIEIIDLGSGWYIYTSIYQDPDNHNKIHCFFTPRDMGSTTNINIYHMYSSDGGDTWRKMNGNAISLPVTSVGEVDLVYTHDRVRIHDVMTDTDGFPHVLAVKDWSTTNPYIYDFYWDGNSWEDDVITNTYYFYSKYTSGGCYDRDNISRVYIAEYHNSKSDMATWVKSSGSWSREEWITGTSDLCIRPMPVYNPHYIRCWWFQCSSYNDYDDWDLDCYGYYNTDMGGGGGGGDYDPPVINHMGYTIGQGDSSGQLGNANVTVDIFWVNFSYDTSGIVDYATIIFYEEYDCITEVYIAYIYEATLGNGYINTSLNALVERSDKLYMRVRVYYE